MRIRDLLDVRSIRLDGVANDKADVLNQMVELMSKSGKINDVETYRKGVFAREEEGTTGIGEGIAIPHCKSKAVSKPGLAAMVVPDGVEYDAAECCEEREGGIYDSNECWVYIEVFGYASTYAAQFPVVRKG